MAIDLLDILVMIPSFAILGLMLWLYIFNRKANVKLMDKSIVKLEPVLLQIGLNRMVISTGSDTMDGRSYGCKVNPESKFRNMKVHYSMEYRHLLPSWIIAKITKNPRDFLIIETELEEGIKPIFSLEIISQNSKNQIKANKDKLKTLAEIKMGNELLENEFLFKSSNNEAAKMFLIGKTVKGSKKNDFLQHLYHMRNNVMRISLDKSKKPALTILVRITDSLDYKILSRLTTLTIERSNYACSKSFIRKKRTN